MKEKIPFKHAPWTLYIKLANKLDPDTGIDGNNWRMLAEKLGYATQEILVSNLFSFLVCYQLNSIALRMAKTP